MSHINCVYYVNGSSYFKQTIKDKTFIIEEFCNQISVHLLPLILQNCQLGTYLLITFD